MWRVKSPKGSYRLGRVKEVIVDYFALDYECSTQNVPGYKKKKNILKWMNGTIVPVSMEEMTNYIVPDS